MIKAINGYKVCSGKEAADYVKDCLKHAYEPLTNEQYRALISEFGNGGMNGNLGMDIQIYKWEEEKTEGQNILWRLTIPFLFLMLCMVHFLLNPINWIITGKWRMSSKNKIYSFVMGWYDKCFKRW